MSDPIYLRGQSAPVHVSEQEDGEQHIAGKNSHGKRFVARKENVRDGADAVGIDVEIPEEAQGRHPFRVYTDVDDEPIRVIHPAFNDVEKWYVDDNADPEITLVREGGKQVKRSRENIVSLLSAMPGAGSD